jgi:hypothetical protein
MFFSLFHSIQTVFFVVSLAMLLFSGSCVITSILLIVALCGVSMWDLPTLLLRTLFFEIPYCLWFDTVPSIIPRMLFDNPSSFSHYPNEFSVMKSLVICTLQSNDLLDFLTSILFPLFWSLLSILFVTDLDPPPHTLLRAFTGHTFNHSLAQTTSGQQNNDDSMDDCDLLDVDCSACCLGHHARSGE